VGRIKARSVGRGPDGMHGQGAYDGSIFLHFDTNSRFGTGRLIVPWLFQTALTVATLKRWGVI